MPSYGGNSRSEHVHPTASTFKGGNSSSARPSSAHQPSQPKEKVQSGLLSWLTTPRPCPEELELRGAFTHERNNHPTAAINSNGESSSSKSTPHYQSFQKNDIVQVEVADPATMQRMKETGINYHDEEMWTARGESMRKSSSISLGSRFGNQDLSIGNVTPTFSPPRPVTTSRTSSSGRVDQQSKKLFDLTSHYPSSTTEVGFKRSFQLDTPEVEAKRNPPSSSSISKQSQQHARPASSLSTSQSQKFISLGPHNAKSLPRKKNLSGVDGASDQESDDPISTTSLTPQQFYSQPSTSTRYNTVSSSHSIPQRNRLPQDAPTISSRLVIEISSSPLRKKHGRLSRNTTTSKPIISLPKKKGRHFKTSNSAAKAHAKAARAKARQRGEFQNEDETRKKQGRALKIRNHIEVLPPPPVYHPFFCEWKGCVAELMNLDTLRRHLHIVHGKKLESGTRVCMWGKCGKATEEDVRIILSVFRSLKEWKEHIEEVHLIPFAWHMGDGPKGTTLGHRDPAQVVAESLAYLNDASGKRVTPSVFDPPQTIESGRAKDNNVRRVRKLLRDIDLDLEPPGMKQMFAKVLLQANGASESETSGFEDNESGVGMYGCR